MSDSSRLNFPYIVNSHILDALVQPVIEEALVNTPPVSPAAGVLYVVGRSPSGAWAGKADSLAQYINDVWTFYVPFEGLTAWNKASKSQWIFSGNQWSETKVEQHSKRNDNPHSVTAAQVGAETPTGAQAKVDIHANKATGAHLASSISVSATGSIGATNVQAALAELDAEKLDVSDVVTTPVANKIVRLNSNAKLPASITGDADTLDGYHAASFVKTTDAVDAAKLNGQPGTYYSTTSHTHTTATSAANGFMSIADKQKLDNLVAGTQQNTFGTIKVGATNVEADAPNDVLELAAGTNIALTPDSVNDRVTISVTGTVPTATSAAACTGNAVTATTLATARTIGISGDATGTATSFNGGANITIPLALPNSGVTAGTYTSLTVDAKGRVTGGTNPTTISANTTGSAATATKLSNLRTINIAGVVAGSANFDGSANISINTTDSRMLWDYTVPASVATIDLPAQVVSLLNSDDIPLEILFHLNITGAVNANYMFSIKPNVNGDSSYVNINNTAYSDIRDSATASLLTIAHYDGLVSGAWPSGLPGLVFAKSTIYRKNNSINLIGLNAYHSPNVRAYSQPLLCQLFMNGTASNYTLGCYTNAGATVVNGVITAETRIIVKRII